jgi:hypothetical protein
MSGLEVGDLDGRAARGGVADRRGADRRLAAGDRLDHALVHAVRRARAEFAAPVVEDIDGTRLGMRQPRRVRDDGRQHGFEVQARIHRLDHVGERLQFADRARQLVGAGAQLAQEARVLDRDHRLVGEAAHRLQLFVVEGPDLGAVDHHQSDRLAQPA